jgi:ketosteroid isomerase-like protein
VGLFFRPRRPLLRLAAGATTATVAYRAGQRRAQQDAYNEQAQAAYEVTQAPPPAATTSSRADLVADLRGRTGIFSDVDLTLDAVDEVGDQVIAEWRVGATHSGPLEPDELRLDPTGRRVELRGVLIAEFEGDRIKRFRQYWDEVALLQGLGLLPED